jgi:hypothetical protein
MPIANSIFLELEKSNIDLQKNNMSLISILCCTI